MPTNTSTILSDLNPGNIIIRPDPLQQQIEQAKLQALLQEPALERQRLNLETQDRARMLEALRSQSALEERRLAGEEEFHRGTLAEEEKKLAAGKEERESISKANLLDTLLTHGLPLEATGQLTKGSIGKIASAFGYPQIEAGTREVSAEDLRNRASTMAGTLKALSPADREKQLAAQPADLRTSVSALLAQSDMNQPTATPTPEDTAPIGTRIGRFLAKIKKPEERDAKQRAAAQQFWKDLYAGFSQPQQKGQLVNQ